MQAGIAIVLLAIWMVGFATSYTFNGALHVMVPLALLLLFMSFMRQRRMI